MGSFQETYIPLGLQGTKIAMIKGLIRWGAAETSTLKCRDSFLWCYDCLFLKFKSNMRRLPNDYENPSLCA